MPDKISSVFAIIARAVVATVCCVVLGLVFYSDQIWNIYYPPFKFVTHGVVGSLFFCSLRAFGIRTSVAILIVLFFAESELVLKSFLYNRLLNDILFFSVAPLAILIFDKLFHAKVDVTTPFDPIILGALFAGASALARTVFELHQQVQPQYWTILHPGRLAPELGMHFLIGFGLAAGFFLTEKFQRHGATERIA